MTYTINLRMVQLTSSSHCFMCGASSCLANSSANCWNCCCSALNPPEAISCEHERKVSGRKGERERWEEEGTWFIRIVVGGPPGSKLLRSHAKLSLRPLRSMHAVV